VIRDEPIYVPASIENPTVNSYIGTTAAIGALAIEFSDGTPPVSSAFSWIKKVSVGHSRLLAASLRRMTRNYGW
jgi:hypothetical protein